MKSPVKPRLMRILLDGKPHGEIALATGAGFTKVATIRKWIDLFGHARFIIRKREDGRTGIFLPAELHAGRHWETLTSTLNPCAPSGDPRGRMVLPAVYRKF